jgi:hypothetical protein
MLADFRLVCSMRFIVQSNEAPVVEIDTAARAVYIRFRKGKVARTISPSARGVVAAIDIDSQERVVGLELLGVCEFGLETLLKKVPSLTVNAPIAEARYVAAENPTLEYVAA